MRSGTRFVWFALAMACSGSKSEPAPPPATTNCDDHSVLTASGCTAVGPTSTMGALACERGTFATPGEDACHPPSAPPIESADLYVDASAPAGGDGTKERPFRSVQSAVTAAAAGARIAIASGIYRENVRVTKALTLLGAGAASTELAGAAADRTALELRAAATVRGLAITSQGLGVTVTDAVVTLSNLWIHDTAKPGVNVDVASTTASVTLEGSLIESAAYAGVASFGAEAHVVSSAIRDTRFLDNKGGPGVLGAFLSGKRPKLVVQKSVIERNREVGVGVAGGDLVVEDCVVRDTSPMSNGTVGYGVLASFDKATGTTPTLSLLRSSVSGSHEIGVALNGGSGTIEQTSVDDTRVRPTDSRFGVGIQGDIKSMLTIRRSLVTRSRHIGIALYGAEGTIEDTIVRDTLLDGANVTAVGIVVTEADGIRSNATITRTLADHNAMAGIAVGGADVKLVDCSARGSITSAEGLFGDGVVGLSSEGKVPSLTIDGLTAEKNARAGVTLFGGSAVVSRSRLLCNRFDLNVESIPAAPSLSDGGENVCGCDGDRHPCRAASNALLEQPAPIRSGR